MASRDIGDGAIAGAITGFIIGVAAILLSLIGLGALTKYFDIRQVFGGLLPAVGGATLTISAMLTHTGFPGDRRPDPRGYLRGDIREHTDHQRDHQRDRLHAGNLDHLRPASPHHRGRGRPGAGRHHSGQHYHIADSVDHLGRTVGLGLHLDRKKSCGTGQSTGCPAVSIAYGGHRGHGELWLHVPIF